MPGDVLGRGIAMAYLSVIALIPLAAVVVHAPFDGRAGRLLERRHAARRRWRRCKLTLIASLIVVLINARDRHADRLGAGARRVPRQGHRQLADRPAVRPARRSSPGLTLLALYGPDSPVGINVAFTRAAVVLALLFVTLPFVVRAVQPVLLELDREMEQAAASLGASRRTVFRRIILPNLLPAILAGGGARLRARRRRVRLAGAASPGNIPFKTQAASVFIFSQVESDNADRRGRGVGGAAGDRARCCCSSSAGCSKKALRHEE